MIKSEFKLKFKNKDDKSRFSFLSFFKQKEEYGLYINNSTLLMNIFKFLLTILMNSNVSKKKFDEYHVKVEPLNQRRTCIYLTSNVMY